MTFNCKDLKSGDVCIMRDGDEAEFMGVNPYNLHQHYIFIHVGNGGVFSYDEHGQFKLASVVSPFDIIRKKPSKIIKWVNVYEDGFDSRHDADKHIAKYAERIACLKIEFEEGEGL